MGDRIAPTEVVHPVAIAPGGTVVLHGQWTLAARDLVIDACQSGPSAGAPTGEGAFDYRAGGWQLQSRDWATHTCRLVATGAPGSACAASGTAACLPLRIRDIAHAQADPMTVTELTNGLVGGMEVEVLTPAVAVLTAPPPPPSWASQHVAGLGAGALVLAAAVVAARVAVRRRATPESLVRRTAARVRGRLARGEPVYQRLVPVVDELAQRAGELAALRDRLQARVARTDRQALVHRRAVLTARGVFSPESADARALVDEQITRVDRWRDEGARAAARLDRVLEYLRALDARLDDDLERTGVRVADDARLLQELEQDVQAALEGAREADRLVAR